MKSVLGIGNAIVDIPVLVPDNSLLETLGLQLGGMNHIDACTERQIRGSLQGMDLHPVQGGSAANTVAAASRLGIKCGFIGKVGKDTLGNHFKEELIHDGVNACLLEGKLPSGRAYTFIGSKSDGISGDAGSARVRTFAAYLGAALEFLPEELAEEMFEGYDCLHVEGYLLQCPGVVERAMEIASAKGMTISFDLGSPGIVKRYYGAIRHLLQEHVDIVFANAPETEAFASAACGAGAVAAMDFKDMAEMLWGAMNGRGANNSIAIVKLGGKGSLVYRYGKCHEMAALPVDVQDTTGAGDAYAAGFLYAYSHGAEMSTCGKAASMLASKAVETVGPKIPAKIIEELLRHTLVKE